VHFLFLNNFSVNKNIIVGNALRYLLKIDLIIHARNERTIKLLVLIRGSILFDNLILIVGLVSGIATLISFLIDKANIGGKYIHALYVFCVTVLASVLVISVSTSQSENEALAAKIEEISSIEYEAAQVLDNSKRSTDGQQRGFIFASLALLERHKSEVPNSYELAKKFALASGVLENKQENGTDRLYQGWRLDDASQAMESLLLGLSAGREKKN